MSESLKGAVRSAVLRLLYPLVRVLMQAGIGVGEFTSLAKIAYVRAAVAQGKETGGEQQRPNVSRISVLTGLTRVDVDAILASDGEAPLAGERGWQRAERVLSGWWNDADFQTQDGRPAVLPIRGARKSFAALCDRYSGETNSSGRILDALLRVRAVKQLRDGRVQALSRTYATVRWNPEGIEALGVHLSEHCATLLHNLEQPSRPRLLRRVVNTRLNPLYAPMLIRDIEQQATSFANSVEDALNDRQYTVTDKTPDVQPMQLGLAVYVFEESPGVEAPGDHSPSGTGKGSGRSRRRRAKGSARV
ncbi:MAG TPA: DUF6502 family protein [Polyangiaceae bacterium]|nr:DUF6502 family protein [Polyangiaceae bacterium]